MHAQHVFAAPCIKPGLQVDTAWLGSKNMTKQGIEMVCKHSTANSLAEEHVVMYELSLVKHMGVTSRLLVWSKIFGRTGMKCFRSDAEEHIVSGDVLVESWIEFWNLLYTWSFHIWEELYIVWALVLVGIFIPETSRSHTLSFIQLVSTLKVYLAGVW